MCTGETIRLHLWSCEPDQKQKEALTDLTGRGVQAPHVSSSEYITLAKYHLEYLVPLGCPKENELSARRPTIGGLCQRVALS